MFISLIGFRSPNRGKGIWNYDHTMTSPGQVIFDHGSMGVIPPLAYATGQATVLVAVFLSPQGSSILLLGHLHRISSQ